MRYLSTGLFLFGVVFLSAQEKPAPVREVEQLIRLEDKYCQRLERISFSPDSKMIAATSDMGLMQVWDIKSGKHIFDSGKIKRKEDYSYMDGAYFSADGKTLIVGSGKVVAYDIEKGNFLRETEDELDHFSLLDDRKTIVAISGKEVSLWDAETLKKTKKIGEIQMDKDERIWRAPMCALPNGKFVVVGLSTGIVQGFPFDKDEKAFRFKFEQEDMKRPPQILGLSIVETEKKTILLASTEYFRGVAVYDLNQSKLLYRIKGWFGVLTKDGKYLITISGKGFKIYDAISGKELSECKADTGPIERVLLSPDGKKLAIALDQFGVRVWNVQDILGDLK